MLVRRAHPAGGDARGCRAARVRDPSRLAFVTQTTLSVDDTQRVVDALRRFPTLASPRKEDICYATQNRQDAVKRLAERCDIILVVGSPTSSNSNRLREIAEKVGIPGYLIDGPEDLQQRMVRRQATSSGSPQALRRRKCWSNAWSPAFVNGAGRRPSIWSASPKTSCSVCRASCGCRCRRSSQARPESRKTPRRARCGPAHGHDVRLGRGRRSRVIGPRPLGKFRSTSSCQQAASCAAASCGKVASSSRGRKRRRPCRR